MKKEGNQRQDAVSESFYQLDEFMSYFSGARERSPATLREYRYDLRLFFRYLLILRGQLPPETPLEAIDLSIVDDAFLRQVKLSEVYRFLSWLSQERGNGPAARARRVSSIRAFFDYLTNKMRVLDSNPVSELEAPKQLKTLPRYLDMEESKALLASAAGSDDRFSSRDYCVLTLFLNCGMRLSELCGMDLADIRGDTLRVVGKGRKERSIYLNRISREALAHWLRERIPARAPDDKAVFVSRNRRRISQRAVENIVKKYLLAAGLDPRRYSAHKLRHTAATLMYQYGEVDLRSLQQILGHESVATTEIYTHITDKMLQRAVERNPLNLLSKEDLQRQALSRQDE